MTKETRMPAQLEDALYALAVADQLPDAGALDELVRAYPAHAAELTDLAVALVLEALDKNDDEVFVEQKDTSPAVSRAMSRFHNELYNVGAIRRAPEIKSAAGTANPFAEFSRSEFQEVGKRLNASTLFVIKLRDRMIDFNTMTEGFLRFVAEAANKPVEVVVAHLSGEQMMAAQAHYKSDTKPSVTQKQTFAEAVHTSNLTEDQQRYLLGL